MARRPGFTLVELLVALAVTAVVLALLLPAIVSARAAALKVICIGRLGDLTLASNLYRTERRAYPLQPGTTLVLDPAAGLPMTALRGALLPPKPTDMDVAFLNSFQPYLPFPPLEGHIQPAQLPPMVQCPTVEDADDNIRVAPADLTFNKPTLYTGFAYCVRPKDATLVPAVRLLRPERVASLKYPDRAVVWADDVHWSLQDVAWSFAHSVPGARRGPTALMYTEASGLMGQHLAYADGSVEWVNASEIDTDIGAGGGASRKASLSVSDLFFFWF